MVFLWIFLPVVFVLYKVLPLRFRNGFLLVASLFFYAWGEPIYVFLMILTIFFNWWLGIILDSKQNGARKFVLFVAVCGNLFILFFFKYTNFIIGIYNSAFHRQVTSINIILPIGISFFTFQAISYIIDLYRGEYKVQKSISKVALYISFFPQLIAGPIVRYKDINHQLCERNETLEKVASGIRRFIYGLAKKVLIANALARSVDLIMDLEIHNISWDIAWLGAILYLFQIYYDFSGYSDMAIGLGRMFGFEFLENFNYPYISRSISEFWRRWHISLGNWFREYLYIPLGGNRRGKIRTIINLSVVFLATGIWHGASWNFVIWGLWHGCFIIIERIGLLKLLDKHKIVSHIYTALIVTLGFVVFRIEDLNFAFQYITRLFLPWRYITSDYAIQELIQNHTVLILIFAIFGCGIIQTWVNKYKEKLSDIMKSWIGLATSTVLFCLCILQLASGTYNPFIYFRF